MMFPPPPMLVFVALLLFTIFHLGIFHPQVLNLAYRCQNIGGTCSKTLPAAFNHGISAGNPLLPDTLSPKIRQVSMRVYSANNETKKAINERCMATHLEYGKRWGYPTHILREVVMGKEQWMDLLFNKPLYILSITIAEMAKPAEERAEWLVFFDSDTIILNPNIPWTLFLPPSDFSNVYFLGTRDWGGGSGFNAGVFFIRVNEWSVKLLTEVSALPDLQPDVQLGYNAEQAAFKWVLRKIGYPEHVLYQPIEWFNGFEDSHGILPPVQDGDMLVHFAGLKDQKPVAMQKWLDRLDRAPYELQIPLKKTGYPANVDAYWMRLRDGRKMMQKAYDWMDGNHTDGHHTTQTLLTAQEKLEQAILDEADNPSFILGAIDLLESALVAAQTGTVPEKTWNIKAPEWISSEEKQSTESPGWAESKDQVAKVATGPPIQQAGIIGKFKTVLSKAAMRKAAMSKLGKSRAGQSKAVPESIAQEP